MNDFTFLDLVKAYKDCRKRKRNTFNAIEFEFDLENNLLQLYEDLKSGTYQIGKSECFIVLRPKPREVWAASFRDRIVHHLVYNAIKDRFYKRFIKDTYSCIPKRGALNGAKTLARYIKSVTDNYTKEAYYLKADIKNFFVTIDKNILYSLLKKHISEQWILDLLKLIVYDNPKQHVIIKSPEKKFTKLPPYKSLWNTPDEKGLPIGNLTSQFFSNVYLDILDRYVKRTLKCKYYCRYVDDFVILSNSPKQLNLIHSQIYQFLKSQLLLDLHLEKKTINKTYSGVDFVGYTIKHNRIFLRQNTLKRIFRLFSSLTKNDFSPRFLNIFHAMNSYLGFLQCVNGFNLRKSICTLNIHNIIDCDIDFTKVFIPFQFVLK